MQEMADTTGVEPTPALGFAQLSVSKTDVRNSRKRRSRCLSSRVCDGGAVNRAAICRGL